jgi:hypothetical protein
MIKKKIILAVALAIPLIMIGITGVNVAYFTHPIKPAQHFMYTVLDNYTQNACIAPLITTILALNASANLNQSANCKNLVIYYYDFDTNKGKPISTEEAKHYINITKRAQPSKYATQADFVQSIDGYKLKTDCSQDIGLAWWTPHNIASPCLVKNNLQVPIQLSTDESAYKFRFIAWVN